jgi:hypothetical protein
MSTLWATALSISPKEKDEPEAAHERHRPQQTRDRSLRMLNIPHEAT